MKQFMYLTVSGVGIAIGIVLISCVIAGVLWGLSVIGS